MTAVRWHLSVVESRPISATAVSNTGRPPVTAVLCPPACGVVSSLVWSINISRSVMTNFYYGLWMTFVKFSSSKNVSLHFTRYFRTVFRKIHEVFSVSALLCSAN